MATVKVNSRSPYYVTATGEEGDTIANASVSISGPSIGVTNSNITLTAVANNFTPVSYSWSGGAINSNTNVSETFTETSDGAVVYGVTATDSAGNTYTASKTVSWSANAQYEATLTVTNDIVGPSAGYTIGGDLNNAVVVGEEGDSYSFTTTLALNSGYNEVSTLTVTPTSHSGTFGTSNVSLTTTLTGRVSLNAGYTLTSRFDDILEGDSVRFFLDTTNLANGTSVPYTITGIQQEDLSLGSLTGAFIVDGNNAFRDIGTIQDSSVEGTETMTMTLDYVSPTVSKSVNIHEGACPGTVLTVQVSADGYSTSQNACSETADTTAYYTLCPGQSFGNDVILWADQELTQPYASAGDIYKIGASYYGTIGQYNDGQISGYTACPEAPPEACTIPTTTGVNSITISSSDASSSGSLGATPCALTLNKPVFYNGTIGNGTILYNNNTLTSIFGGSGDYYRLSINSCDYYARIGSVNNGEVTGLTQCGYEEAPSPIPPTPEPTPEPTTYYARFITCNEPGGGITSVFSSSQISTSTVIKDGNECREYLDSQQDPTAVDILSLIHI